MIKCTKCSFLVNQDMKFALMQNICPACGEHLLSQDEITQIKILQSKLEQIKTVESLSADTKYDISLFTLREIRDGLGKTYVVAALEAYRKKIKADGPSQQESGEASDVEFTESSLDEMKEQIRKEVETELQPQIRRIASASTRKLQKKQEDYDDEIIDVDSPYVSEDEDFLRKVERLQNLAKQRAGQKATSQGPTQLKAKHMDEISSSAKIRRSD